MEQSSIESIPKQQSTLPIAAGKEQIPASINKEEDCGNINVTNKSSTEATVRPKIEKGSSNAVKLEEVPDSSVCSSKSKYVKDFDLLFVPLKAEQLQQKARSGNLKNCKFRSLCWRYFLSCLPEDFNQWLPACELSREQYNIIKAKHYDQLQDEENQSNSIYKTIQRDVIRTFPDMEFFRQTEMQNILGNVLYNFASENNELSYKQGMHELVATLLYVLHTDSQDCLINYEGGYATQTIGTLLDLKFLEHDVFHLFSAFMKYLEPWYQNDDSLMIQDDGPGFPKKPSSVLSVKLKKISESIVKYYDSELFYHLEALQIAPQIYGIRWMRLLFGREFEFLDLLALWDVLICDSKPMSLTDYVFASMLITIREELVNGDYTDCLNNLMRHQFEDVQHVIKLALHIRDPSENQPPQTRHVTFKSSTQHGSTRYLMDPLSSRVDRLSQRYLTNDKQSMRGNNQYSNPISSNSTDPRKALNNSKNKFLPNINKFVSSIGQNIQDKTIHSQSSSRHNRNLQQSNRYSSTSSQSSNWDKNVQNTKQHTQRSQQQVSHRVQQFHPNRPALNEVPLLSTPIKEYELREMLSTSSRSTSSALKDTTRAPTRFPIGHIGRGENTSGTQNVSTESYEDLHSIVDYCWRLLSEQIDSLQRCLPREKSLMSEDEIFVALAQLKKVRDVLKGSLRLEDELDTTASGQKT